MAVITAISLLFSPLLQASCNWLGETRSSDSALFPDSWDGMGLEGGKFLSERLSQAQSTQGVSLLTQLRAFKVATSGRPSVGYSCVMCLLAINTGSVSVSVLLSALHMNASYLERGQLSLLGQESLLLFRRVGVVAVLIQPVPEDLHRLLRQVAPPLPLPVAPAAGRQIQGCVHAVLVFCLAPRQHHQTCTKTESRRHDELSGVEGGGGGKRTSSVT